MIRALIVDLDNTIYPVKSISDDLFAAFFKLIDDHAGELGTYVVNEAKEEMTRVSFQKVAKKYDFSEELTEKGIQFLKEAILTKSMFAYDDYKHIQNLTIDRFLVTTGFVKMQNSKVNMLGICNDFKNVYIVDPSTSSKTKKDIFEQIIADYHYKPNEVLIVGDDPESEIKFAKLAGLKTVLYDPTGKYQPSEADYHIKNHAELGQLILQ